MPITATNEQEFEAERLLSDIHLKVDQLMAADIEAHEAGVTDGPLPSLGGDWEGWLEEEEETTGKQAWKELKVFAEQERKQLVLERRKRYIQTLLLQYLVNEWFKRNTSIKDGVEIRKTADALKGLLKDNHIKEAKLYLTDVLSLGVKRAEKQQRKRYRGGWAWIIYAFTAFRGLIYTGVVLAIFNVANSKFEKVSLALVVIIGNMLLTNRDTDLLYRLRISGVRDRQFNELRRFFRLPEDEQEREVKEEARFEADKSLARTAISAYIGLLFAGIVWIICAVELISVFW